jgi:hypothetical protein
LGFPEKPFLSWILVTARVSRGFAGYLQDAQTPEIGMGEEIE